MKNYYKQCEILIDNEEKEGITILGRETDVRQVCSWRLCLLYTKNEMDHILPFKVVAIYDFLP